MTITNDKDKAYIIQCQFCGETASIDNKIIDDLQNLIHLKHDFEVDYCYLNIRGYCKRCQERR